MSHPTVSKRETAYYILYFAVFVMGTLAIFLNMEAKIVMNQAVNTQTASNR